MSLINREDVDAGGPWWWSEICDHCWNNLVAPSLELDEEEEE